MSEKTIIPTVEEEWKRFRKACYGEDVLHPLQEAEVRASFLSGYFDALAMVSGPITDLSDDEAVEAIARLYKEAKQLLLVRVAELNIGRS